MTNKSIKPPDGQTEASAAIPPEETARILTTFSAFLRDNSSERDEESSSAIAEQTDEVANTARVHIEAEDEAGTEVEKYPSWARHMPNLDKVFVEPKYDIDMWHANAETLGRGKNEIVINYKRLDDKLDPGGNKEEQGVELKIINNTFKLDEWEYIVQPILERYVNALELQKLSRVVGKDKKIIREKIHLLLPQVFSKKQASDLLEVEMTTKAFKKQIDEVLNEINVNPDILSQWIKEEVGEEVPGEIQKKKINKGNVSAQYKITQKSAGIRRLMNRFEKTEHKEPEQEKAVYINDLAERISKLGEQLLFLNKKYSQGIYPVPAIKKDFVETPHYRETLEELTEKVARQLEEKKGMVSIIGDMGTGKNYIVEHFATKTNRPFLFFPCSRGMDAADLGFHFEFRKGESIVVPSQLAKGLKTKNSLILIDEPNALPPEVVAALHGLADHNRSFVYNGVEFKAAEGVTIVMTMNPATYAHVKDLPEAFSDRTLGQDMLLDYPPITKLDKLSQENMWSDAEREQALQEDNELDKIFICDEALILKNQFPDLKKWSDEDFINLWNVVINGEGTGLLGDKVDELDRLELPVKAIHTILKICDTWRKKYKLGDMQRTISLRGSSAVATNFLKTRDVRKAFLDLYKPHSKKYDGGEEDYETLEEVLNDMGELEKAINSES